MKLRPYQATAVNCIKGEWEEGRRSTLLVLPTGTGKTIVFATLAGDMASNGKRSLILAHRDELLSQASDKIKMVTGLECSVEKAGQSCLRSDSPITVGSVQTLMRDTRLNMINPDRFDAVIVDEAHHALADSYRKILDHFPEANVLGVTATPDRMDRKNLSEVFDSIAYEYTLPQAIKDGYLCPIMAQTIPLDIDITSVRQSNGDYSLGDLGSALDPYLEAIADEMMNIGCANMHTVVFLPLVATSQRFCDLLNERGLRAAEINGESPDRAEILADFSAGKYQVLCNSMLLTEGWDCPSVDCIVVLRATRSRALYCQMVGRGTRLSPETGKKRLLLLDFLWHTETHDLCRPAYLIAPSDDIANRMTGKMAGGCGPFDLEEILDEASTDAMNDREGQLAKQLKAMRHRQRKLVDPLQYEMSIADEALANYVPTFRWEFDPITDKQRDALEKFQIDPDGVDSKGKAKFLLDKLIKRSKANLASPKQIRLLERRGFTHVGQWSKAEASSVIGQIEKNNWHVPYYINPATYLPESLREGHSYDRCA